MRADSVRTALVTGANRGIGLAIAKGLAARDDIHLLAASRRDEDVHDALAEIGSGAVGVTLDLSDPEDVPRRAEAIQLEHGPVDILVNNAAILVRGDGLEIGVDDLIRSFAVNTIAPFALIRALAPGMQARSFGRIVNVSSGWGSFDEGLTGPAAYSITKAALNAVTVSFARTLDRTVKVNAACPGWVRTRMGGEAASRSPEQGAETPIWLATLPDDGPSGGFFRDRQRIAW